MSHWKVQNKVVKNGQSSSGYYTNSRKFYCSLFLSLTLASTDYSKKREFLGFLRRFQRESKGKTRVLFFKSIAASSDLLLCSSLNFIAILVILLITIDTKKMLGCKRCCRNCFPNGCCGFCKPTPKVQEQVDTIVRVKKAVEEKETPYGYINFYPGKENLSWRCLICPFH